MKLSWLLHLELACSVEASGDQERGTALALMGVGLALLLRDLEYHLLSAQSAPVRGSGS